MLSLSLSLFQVGASRARHIIVSGQFQDAEWKAFREASTARQRASQAMAHANDGVGQWSNNPNVFDPRDHHAMSPIHDFDVTMSLLGIQSNFPDVPVTVEMSTAANVQFLRPRLDPRHMPNYMRSAWKRAEGYCLAPTFAAGRVFTPAYLDRLMCQAFYNDRVVPVIECLAGSGHLMDLEVDAGMVGKTFSELFVSLLKTRGLLAVALYRHQDFWPSPLPFVYTAPDGDTVVGEGDLVIALSSTVSG